MYSLRSYGAMIADPVRIEAYARALERVVHPGAVVVDLGAGTGVMSLIACRLGARRVYAIEPEDVIQVARELAAANGCADRIEFIQALSTRIELPERADVIVADLRGILPWHDGMVAAMADARQRLLAPGGRIIPERDVTWVVPVSAADEHARQVTPPAGARGWDWSALRRRTANSWCACRLPPEAMLAEPQQWQVVEYQTLQEPDATGALDFEVRHAGLGHGLLAWFDTTLTGGVGFSNAPGGPELIYSAAFFPWPEAVPLAAGEHLHVQLEARLVGEHYVWRWETEVRDRAGALRAELRQAELHGAALSPARLRRFALEHTPRLSEDGAIDQLALSLMDGGRSVAEIAEELQRRFPRAFPGLREARSRVAGLSVKYGR
jgi:protein arginine N-methyltransferase 1